MQGLAGSGLINKQSLLNIDNPSYFSWFNIGSFFFFQHDPDHPCILPFLVQNNQPSLFKPTFKKTSIRVQKRKKERKKKERRKKDGKWKVESGKERKKERKKESKKVSK